MKKIQLSLLLFLITTLAFAQAPAKMSYQSVVRNGSGLVVANSNVGFRISLLQGSATGTIAFAETHTVTTDANGVASLEIGGGTPVTTTFASINWANGPYFIKTEADPAGGTNYTISGTSQLLSVPYALYATNGLPQGTAAGNTLYWNGTSWINNGNIFNNGGNVGIGTTTPIAKLDVVGNIKIKDGTEGAGKVLTSDGTGLASWGTTSAGWGLTGNSGTVDGTNFIGTTDNVPLNFRMKNQIAGRVDDANSFYGYRAGNFTTRISQDGNESIDNCGIGRGALYSNTVGQANTAVGATAQSASTTATENTSIGSSSLYTNIIGFKNTAAGARSLFSNTGNLNTALGYDAGANLSSGSNNTVVGYNAQAPNPTASNQVRIGNTAVSYAGIQVAWTITSDRRLKSDIKPSNLGLEFIQTLRPVSYFRSNNERREIEYGFIAQEVEAALNSTGAAGNGIISKDSEGVYSVRYNDLIAPLVKAVQEQQQMIEELKKENNELKGTNTQLTSKLTSLQEKQDTEIAALKKQIEEVMRIVGAEAKKKKD